MGTVHDLIEFRGKQEALKLDGDRFVIEAAAACMSDEDRGIGCLYSGWCQAALPHRRLADDQGWQIDGERVCLIVEPGMRRASSGKPEPVGVPYGSPGQAHSASATIGSTADRQPGGRAWEKPAGLALPDGHSGRGRLCLRRSGTRQSGFPVAG